MGNRKILLAVAVVALALTAGCLGPGWGEDGPVDTNDTTEENRSVEEADRTNESNASGTSSGESSGDSSGSQSADDGSSDSQDETSSTSESYGAEGASGDNGGIDDQSQSDDDTTESSVDDTESDSQSGASGDTDDSSTDQDGGDESNSGTNDDGESDDSTSGTDQKDNETNETGSTQTHTITVKVVEQDTVTLERVGDGATTTRQSSNGTVQFIVNDEDFYRLSSNNHMDTMIEMGFDEDSTIQLQYPSDSSMTINVVDAETGEPIEGAEISGVCDMWYSGGDDYIAGTSNADGIIVTDSLTPTRCDAEIRADGYEPSGSIDVEVPDEDGMTVELQQEETEEYQQLTISEAENNQQVVISNPNEGPVSLNGWQVVSDGEQDPGAANQLSGQLESGEQTTVGVYGSHQALVNPNGEVVSTVDYGDES